MITANKSAERPMDISAERVRKIFEGLENGDGAAFFQNVADDVNWTVMGTHPLAGHYSSKQSFIEGTFAKLGRVLPHGTQLRVEHLLVKGDQAVVELRSFATAKNGMRFDNRYCWVVSFKDELIVAVRAYLDSAMVARLFEENPIRAQLSSDEAKQVVLNLGAAINDENFQTARLYVADDLKYEGPFGTRLGAEAYLKEIERLRLKFDIQRIFADQEDVCALYNIDTAGITVFACGWFQIKDGKSAPLR